MGVKRDLSIKEKGIMQDPQRVHKGRWKKQERVNKKSSIFFL